MSDPRDIEPRPRARGLRLAIAAVVAAAVISMWTGVVISIQHSRDTARKDIESTASNLALAFDGEVSHTLDNVVGIMDAVANRIRAQESDLNLYAWSRQFPIVVGPIVEVGVIAPNGKGIVETKAPAARAIDVSNEEYFRIHLDGNFQSLFIGTPLKNPIYDQVVFPITRRVETRGGRFLGVLIAFVSPTRLTKLQKSIDLGDNGSITLVGAHDVVLSRFSEKSPDGLEDLGEPITGKLDPEVAEKGDQGSYVLQDTTDHVRRLFSYRRSTDYPVVISVGLDYDSGLALVRAHASTISALAAVATLLLGGLAFYLNCEIRRRATRDSELAAERGKLHAANVDLQSANAELTKSKEVAEVASQTKSLFLANMSHELRTPLNAIIGFSQMIREQTMGPVRAIYTDYANDIFTAGSHLLEIINNLLDISKIEAGKTDIRDEVVDISEILISSVAAVRMQAHTKKLDLLLDVPQNIPQVRADAVRLRQVFINLLSNAVKFTEVGQVRVTAARDDVRGVTVAVADTGIGMSPEETAIALEPFGQVENVTTKKYEGTGLGLTIARHLVELHGGHLMIDSTKGAGTTIRVQLPAERLHTEGHIVTLSEVAPLARRAGRA